MKWKEKKKEAIKWVVKKWYGCEYNDINNEMKMKRTIWDIGHNSQIKSADN